MARLGRCAKTSTFKFVIGLAFVILGIVFLLKATGLLTIPALGGFRLLWPIAIILIGIALVFRMRLVAIGVLVVALVLGGVVISETANHATRQVTQIIALDGAKEGVVNAGFGAGETTIGSGEDASLLHSFIVTTTSEDPRVEVSTEGTAKTVKLEQRGTMGWGPERQENWSLKLSPAIPYGITLHYGAAKLNADLRNLKVASLNLSTGASSTTIYYGRYPTATLIEAGASSIELYIPEGYPAKIHVEGGLVGKDFQGQGMTLQGDSYVSSAYQAGQPAIDITIKAGATSVNVQTD